MILHIFGDKVIIFSIVDLPNDTYICLHAQGLSTTNCYNNKLKIYWEERRARFGNRSTENLWFLIITHYVKIN
jgi:hypothetical protein